MCTEIVTAKKVDHLQLVPTVCSSSRHFLLTLVSLSCKKIHFPFLPKTKSSINRTFLQLLYEVCGSSTHANYERRTVEQPQDLK